MPHRYLLCLLLALGGCATATHLPAGPDYCDPPLVYRYDPAFAPKADFEAALTPALRARFPYRNLLSANAVGVLPALQQLLGLEAEARQHPGPGPELAVLRQRQLVLAQVAVVSATISSVAAELDCEGERADQLSAYLGKLDNSRTQRLNVLSISIGAASGIGTTLFDNKGPQYAFGVGGGLLGASLGLLTLRQAGHTAEFNHPRNLLTDIWNEQATPGQWPPSVWYMLTDKAFSNFGRASIAYNTRKRWMSYDQLAHPESRQDQRLLALLLGPGGHYSADDLTVRANMLNELQAAVRLLNQEMQGLLLVLNE